MTGEVERVLLGDSARPSAESCTTAAARTLAQTVVTSCASGVNLLISTCHMHCKSSTQLLNHKLLLLPVPVLTVWSSCVHYTTETLVYVGFEVQ